MGSSQIFQWFVYQQDYLWFVTASGWAALLVVWRRSGRAAPELRWLPCGAAAALLTSAVEVSQFITPVVQKPFIPPWLAWDLALGVVHALLIGGLGWVLTRGKKRGMLQFSAWLVLAAAAATLHYFRSFAGSVALTLLVFVAVAQLLRRAGGSRSGRLALLALAGAVLFATNGPLAEGLGLSHRYTDLSPYGLAAAGCLLGTLVAAGFCLYRHVGAAAGSPVTLGDLRLLLRSQSLWLSLGLVLAAVMGAWARAGFEGNLLARVRMAGELVDKKSFADHLEPAFRVDNTHHEFFQGQELFAYQSHYLATHRPRQLADQLAQIELANPDVDWAMLITLRGGQLLIFTDSSRMPPPVRAGENGNYGPPDAATWRAWAEHRAEVVGPVNFYYGFVVQARAPLLSPAGRMLGWLVFDTSIAQWLAAQAQARLLAFLVIALGSALLVVDWQQRIRERGRAAARREADAALAANRVKAAFLAKVSHELRTPIQSLLGYSELLRQRVADDPKAAGWLNSLHQHGELMTRLVNDLVDLGAIEAGAFQLAARTINPGDLVAQTVESFRPRAEARQLNLACFIAGGVPAWVALDGERFRQVLTNLVGNALKFTDRGGVTIALRAENSDRLVLTVRDTGPGIPPAEQGRLFVAFSRLELTADKEGTGLGLALSAALCRAMGGELGVASDGQTGTCFTATVQAPPVAPPVLAKPAEPPSTLHGRRVLVVDDNPLVRELFVAFLTEQGALCAAAATGAEALAHAGTSEFNTIILDLALPDGDGTAFVQPLRERADGARIVGVSAHAGSVDRARALAAGMDAFFTKPVSLGALAAAVLEVSPGRAAADPVFRTADALRERLTRQFVRELPAQRAQIAAALLARDWPRVCALAHHLKNSAVVVRDDALFDVCTGLEHAALDGSEAAAARWWARCTPHFDRWFGPATPASTPAPG